MDNASLLGNEDCRFESCQGHAHAGSCKGRTQVYACMDATKSPGTWCGGIASASYTTGTLYAPLSRCTVLPSSRVTHTWKNVTAVPASQPPWHHGYGVGLLIQGLWARSPQGVTMQDPRGPGHALEPSCPTSLEHDLPGLPRTLGRGVVC